MRGILAYPQMTPQMTSHTGVLLAGPISSFDLHYTLTRSHRSVYHLPSTDAQNTIKISEKYTVLQLASGGNLSEAYLSHTRLTRPSSATIIHKAVDYLL